MPITGAFNEAVRYVAHSMGWPIWATGVFVVLASFSSLFSVIKSQLEGPNESSKVVKGHSFRSFQRKYLLVYYVIMMADWLQGTNMYTLYQGYGVDVGALFLTGFLSSAIFSLFIGVYVDRYGRKLGCIVYCALEVAINICEHYNNFPLLWTSRVLGGISTCLLFSAFETWMVAAHRKEGFSEELLADTFSLMSVGNGMVAIVAGFLAQISADALGDIGPFQIAIFLTCVAWVLIGMFWDENTGDKQPDQGTSDAGTNFGLAWKEAKKPTVFFVSMSSALFEGAMYSFVFMWVPALQTVLDGAPLPTGLVFSSFMVCITIGGMIFSFMNYCQKWVRLEYSAMCIYLVAAACMLVPVSTGMEFWSVLCCFLVLEACIGVFFAVSGTLRSKYIEESTQCSVMNLFRVPLNLLVVTGTKFTDWYPLETVFMVVASWFGIAALLQFGLANASSPAEDQAKKVK